MTILSNTIEMILRRPENYRLLQDHIAASEQDSVNVFNAGKLNQLQKDVDRAVWEMVVYGSDLPVAHNIDAESVQLRLNEFYVNFDQQKQHIRQFSIYNIDERRVEYAARELDEKIRDQFETWSQQNIDAWAGNVCGALEDACYTSNYGIRNVLFLLEHRQVDNNIVKGLIHNKNTDTLTLDELNQLYENTYVL